MNTDFLFNEEEKRNDRPILKHLGYYIYAQFTCIVKDFFRNPYYDVRKKELNILDTIQTLLDSETTDENISKCKDLSRLHRIVENTKARRGLEKWSLRVIASYLFIVLCIVVANYINIDGLKFLNISDGVMITILSTTTINIIGLGLIVLRGHFLAKDANNMEEDK